MKKRGQVWISAALYTALGIILVTLILSVGMPFVNKLKERNTVLQTKNVLYELDGVIRTVYSEGYGSKRPVFVDIGEGDFEISAADNEISWSIVSEEKLGIEPGVDIEEGNLKIRSEKLGQGYKIKLFLDYGTGVKEEIDIRSKLKMLSGKYNLVVEHGIDSSVDPAESYVDICDGKCD